MARYIEANDLVRVMTLQANRTMFGEISPPHLSYSEMLEIIADAPTADVAPKSEVEKIIEETFKRVRENFVISPLCKSALSDLEAELKKKYTEET